MINTKKGFTLVELLVVIGILAVLATATTLILNPAEYLKQSRDTKRIADLDSISSALNLMVAGIAPSANWFGNAACGATTSAAPDDTGYTTCTARLGVRTLGTAGWVNAKLDSTNFPSTPLVTLPLDPTNAVNTGAAVSDYFYAYKGGTATGQETTYEIVTRLESTKFAETQNLDANDGGSDTGMYEVGSSLSQI